MNSCVINEEWAKIKQHKNWDVSFDVFKQSSKQKKCDKNKSWLICSVRAGEYLEFYCLGNLNPKETLTLALYAFVS